MCVHMGTKERTPLFPGISLFFLSFFRSVLSEDSIAHGSLNGVISTPSTQLVELPAGVCVYNCTVWQKNKIKRQLNRINRCMKSSSSWTLVPKTINAFSDRLFWMDSDKGLMSLQARQQRTLTEATTAQQGKVFAKLTKVNIESPRAQIQKKFESTTSRFNP